MPELPEVEIIKNQLQAKLINRTFANIIVRNNRLRQVITSDFSKKLQNKEIIKLSRRAKYIIIHLTGWINLIVHLGMTGQLVLYPNLHEFTKHDHVVFTFSDGQDMLVYNDIRRFGLLAILTDAELKTNKLFSTLGPEPLEEDFTVEYLLAKLRNRTINIKTSLMNNEIVVGIGNIYANEILFQSGILPTRPSNQVTPTELELIITNTRNILNKAIYLGGSSFSNYVDSTGSKGNFQNEFQVYNQVGNGCKLCGNIIKKMQMNGRSCYYCDGCQK